MEKSILKQKRKIGFSLALLLLSSQLVYSLICFGVMFFDIRKTLLLDYLINAFSIYVVAFLVVKLWLRKVEDVEQKPKVKLGVKKMLWYIFACLGLGIFCSTVTAEITTLITAPFGGEISDRVDEVISESTPSLIVVFVAIVGPIFEELIFRGLLLKKLRVYGDKTAIIYNAIAFGLFHTNVSQILFAGVVGAVLAYVVVKSNNIKYSIIIHMSINLLGSMSTILEYTGIEALKTLFSIAMTFLVITAVIVIPLNGAKYGLYVSDESKYEKKKLYNNIGYIFSCIIVVILTILSAIS